MFRPNRRLAVQSFYYKNLSLKVYICFVSDPVWPHVTNGQIPNGFPTSQSLNFAAPKVPWNSEAMSNPFAV